MNHKNLNAWKESMALVKEVYTLIDNFPKKEIFALSSQMQRSAISIPSNIAEGAGRNSDKEFVHFCYIAMGSLAELDTQLIIATELNYINKEHEIFNVITNVRKLLSGLIAYLKNKDKEN